MFLAESLWEPIERVECRCVRCHTIISHFSTGQQLNNQLEHIDVQLFVVRGNERRLHTLSMAGNRLSALPKVEALAHHTTCPTPSFGLVTQQNFVISYTFFTFFEFFEFIIFIIFNFLEAFKRHCLANFSI